LRQANRKQDGASYRRKSKATPNEEKSIDPSVGRIIRVIENPNL
jgi:hypothetical protein